MSSIRIEAINEAHFDDFLNYLKKHLSENGDNNAYFLPLTKAQSKFNETWANKFKNGINKSFNEVGWRKLWLAINQENKIVGHIDIRSRNQLNTEHRVLLGMGTDINFRNLKIGQQLLTFVIDYSKRQSNISWIDLEVLTDNTAAIHLYEKMDFELISHVKDMFRIQNKSYAYNSMTLNVE